jgi:methylated-DNA-protein-cysteine methyltransferase related protein
MTAHARILSAIRKIPRGKVSTYGAIARAAGSPRAARQVARALHRSFDLPWQRVLGAGGEIKLRGDSAIEQRLRLESEGVVFRGRRVDMKKHEFKFPRAKAEPARPKKNRRAGRISDSSASAPKKQNLKHSRYVLNCSSIST